jgi:glycosyltransferase involved in cell wall biosynthesis
MDWEGFAATKNRAIDETTQPWVLSLDADEWITDAGAREIRRVLADPRHDVYAMPRRPAFVGAFVDRVWSGDAPLRLFRRDAARFSGGPVHETLRPGAGRSIGRLREAAPHLTYRTLTEYVARMNRYTDLAADGLVRDGNDAGPLRMIVSSLAALFRTYVAKRGFLDGRRGCIVAVDSAFYAFLKHAKHWERGRDVSDALRRAATPTPEDPDPAARDGGEGQSG